MERFIELPLQGTKVKESTVFTRKYCTELTNLSMLSVFEVEIWCYRGGDKIPLWIERHAGEFACDASHTELTRILVQRTSLHSVL